MIQIFIDYSNNRVTGYNTIIPKNIKDVILVDDDNMPLLSTITANRNLYYVDGKVVEISSPKENLEKNENNLLYNELDRVNEMVNNEYKIFMDNIIAGMSLEDARKISNENREKLKNLQEQKEKIDKIYREERESGILRLFEKEESQKDYKYFLSMVTVVRDENDYLEEWIRYHIEELGFEHFYIYDNESIVSPIDYFEQTGFKYKDKITVSGWFTSTFTQQDIHNHFLQTYAHETKWFLGADPDEYVFIKDKSKTLKEFLNENSGYATIKCVWRHFNANGRTKKTNEPDMVRFTQDVDWDDWRHGGKKFAQSNRIDHFESYTPCVRLETKEMDYDNEIATDFFQLNHYYTRSYEEWTEKIMVRGSVHPGFLRKFSEFFELNPDMKYLDTGEEHIQPYGSAFNKNVNDIIT